LSDGMDMSMVCIDKSLRTLTFSGAKRPIIWISKGELNYVKGDSLPIGGLINHERDYKEIVIDIEEDTILYLFSDGYTDQFGGDEDQKFMMKNFRDLLLNISEKGMNQQYNIIKNCLNNWQSSCPQTDDILVIGVKICPQK
jgi:serine phosphatase RsbU (regulator of sigma subunit)